MKSKVKSYRCPKFDGDAKQTLEIRVERKRNNRSKFSRENEGGILITEISPSLNLAVEFT